MTSEARDSKERLSTLAMIRKYIMKTLGLEASEENYRRVIWTLPNGKKNSKRFLPYDGMENAWEEIFSTIGCPNYFIVLHNEEELRIQPEWYRDHMAAECAARHLPMIPAWRLPPRFIEYMGSLLEIEVVVKEYFAPNEVV